MPTAVHYSRLLTSYGLTQWAPYVEAEVINWVDGPDIRKVSIAFVDRLTEFVDPSFAEVMQLMAPLIAAYAEAYRRLVYS